MENNGKELAGSAFDVINELMGEIHAARLVGVTALKCPEVFRTKHLHFIVRISIGAILLALRKFDDIWNAQIEPVLLSDNPPRDGIEVKEEIERRKLRDFCNILVAHYSEHKRWSKTPYPKIEELLRNQEFNSDEEFFVWTNKIVEKLNIIRDRIAEKYDLNK